MIGYVTLGTKDLPRASAYYDALFASINVGRFMEEENYFVAWSPSHDAPALSVTRLSPRNRQQRFLCRVFPRTGW